MPLTTTNYGFKKPQANEYVKPDDFNDNWDSLDGKLKTVENNIAGVKASAAPVTTTGTGAAYLAAVDGITELSVGLTLTIIPHRGGTSTEPTLNLNSLGAKVIKQKLSGATGTVTAGSSAGWITASKPLTVRYDGTQWIADLIKPSASDLSGAVPISAGGTGQSTAAGARQSLGAEALHQVAAATLTVAGWSSNSQTVNVSGVTAGNDIIVAPAPASYEAWGKAGVVCTAQAAGELTFTCSKTPTAALTANIVILGG